MTLPDLKQLKQIDTYLDAPKHAPINFDERHLFSIINFIRDELSGFSLTELATLSETRHHEIKQILEESSPPADDDYLIVFVNVIRKMVPLGKLTKKQTKKTQLNPLLYIAIGLIFGLSFCTLPISFASLLNLTLSPILGLISTATLLLTGTIFTAERVRRARRPHIERLQLANMEYRLRHANNRIQRDLLPPTIPLEKSYGLKFWRWPWMNKFAWIRLFLTSGLGLSATIIGLMVTMAKFAGISALVASSLGPAAPFAIAAIGVVLAIGLAACVIYSAYKKYQLVAETKRVHKKIQAEIAYEANLPHELFGKLNVANRHELQLYAARVINDSLAEIVDQGKQKQGPSGTEFLDTFFQKDAKEVYLLADQWRALRALKQDLSIHIASRKPFKFTDVIQHHRSLYPVLDPHHSPHSAVAKRLEEIIQAEKKLPPEDKPSDDKALHQ